MNPEQNDYEYFRKKLIDEYFDNINDDDDEDYEEIEIEEVDEFYLEDEPAYEDDEEYELTLIHEYYDGEDNYLLEKGKLYIGATDVDTIEELIEHSKTEQFFEEQKEEAKQAGLNLLEIYAYVEYRSHTVAVLFIQFKVEKLVE